MHNGNIFEYNSPVFFFFLKCLIRLGRNTIFRVLMRENKQGLLNSPEEGETRPS